MKIWRSKDFRNPLEGFPINKKSNAIEHQKMVVCYLIFADKLDARITKTNRVPLKISE